ncbi:MAG: IS4 family transposase [Trueperaceae bacterium]|nr:IS4 family transposase [Trueperaceae bacterium]
MAARWRCRTRRRTPSGFGRPGVSRGKRSAYPRVRWVALGEVGTRAIVGLSAGAYTDSELTLAKPLLSRLQPGMLCLCDRAYFGFHAWQEAHATGAELLWRLKRNAVFPVEERLPDGSFLSQVFKSPNDRRKGLPGVPIRILEYALDDPGRPQAAQAYRLATTILDPKDAPAEELAALYAKRWDIEISIKEVKASQGGTHLVLRSRTPGGVIQELYGFACVHYAIRWLLHQAALGGNVDTGRLSFTGGLRAMRRKLSRPESVSPHDPNHADP